MSTIFDNLARGVARGTSRRDVLRAFVGGLAGLLLSSLGIRKVSAAAATCGTCQACNLDTNVCGLPCTPPSAGTALCAHVGSDGSYLRLVNYLTNNGFASVGASNSVIFYRSGGLFQSVLATNFQNLSVPDETAVIVYALSPIGGVSTLAVLYQDGVQSFALGVDPDGRVFQTVATQTSSTSASSASAEAGRQERPDNSTPKTNAGVVVPDLTPGQCDLLVDIFCGIVFVGDVACYFAIAALCPETGPGAIPCALFLGGLCAAGTEFVCKELGAIECKCPPNQQICDGICCDPCMDCLNGACVPNVRCGGQCCNNICCDPGFTCDPTTNQCTSPNSGCVGATCSTFVPCSSSNPDCVCGSIVEGGGLCVPGSTPCAGLAPCTNSGDCGPDALCLFGSCCGEPVCVPISLSAQCPSGTASRSSVKLLPKVPAGSGPTIGHR